MSYTANQYNYATPLSSAPGVVDETSAIADVKYFTLFDNKLDGTYLPISGDVGLWGSTLSGTDGNLSEPFVFTISGDFAVNAICVRGSTYSYPVNFRVELYSGSTRVYNVPIASNREVERVELLSKTVKADKCIITVSKISATNAVARLYNTYNPGYVLRSDTLGLGVSEDSSAIQLLSIFKSETLKVQSNASSVAKTVIVSADDSAVVCAMCSDILANTIVNETLSADINIVDGNETRELSNTSFVSDVIVVSAHFESHIHNIIDVTHDTTKVAIAEDTSNIANIIDISNDNCYTYTHEEPSLTNVHTTMKQPFRRVYGKVYITYTDPMLNDVIKDISASDIAYNSNMQQLVNGSSAPTELYFTLYNNDLSGKYKLSSSTSSVGWTSKQISDENGLFAASPHVLISFEATRPVSNLLINFNDAQECLAIDFDVTFIRSSGNIVRSFTNNDAYSVSVLVNEAISEVSAVQITIHRVSKPYYPAIILEAPVGSTFIYVGYQDTSSLINMNILEELTYDDDVEALGGVSANEVTVTLDNSHRGFNVDNPRSPVSSQLRRNRKIVPYLGTEVVPGEIEWHRLGTYWSYRWDVPYDSLSATVVGFDTIGLLSTSSFESHTVQVNKSLGYLIDYVLSDAKELLEFIDWYVDESLYNVIIPYAWFEPSSHAAALRRISKAYPMHIYCDRDGRICALPQKLKLDYYYDTWSDSTNVISKKYTSLHTVLPNVINVAVVSPAPKYNADLAVDTLTFNVQTIAERTLRFNAPYLSDISINIDKDATVDYTYEVYSWGIKFTFTGTGNVRSIACYGTALDLSNTTSVVWKDRASAVSNGVIARDISAEFIQTVDLASFIINRITSLSTLDKYDAEVTYRGDISLTINDPILLLDGIAPDTRYNIKRHQLTWDGSLTGVANLNT